ncbi:hypothetical protein [Parenemella sanctibonifatiensis]|uniref:SMP-30/Gluconolactonase/LRE-like region domain-containing protein n=1 Tax=Parenemella sanctibonifatiensis TaxID=2016505 RepID=A0A255ELB7_9ACTN|nr:hypothetical protein [Parenemella sanctibonifatiensis]OYN92020.1 hypothetical protein CGZ91_00360 [Parenemella sanctibonifatiensis]
MAYNPERDEMYVGSVPAYGVYQGGLAIYSFATGKVEFFGAEIAENQGIVSAVWNPHDKLLYLGTTIDGGMGTNPTSIPELGQLVVFDPETRTVVRSGAPVRLREGVTGLLVDPDGSVWGVAEEQLMKVSPDGTVRTLGAVSGRYADPPAYTWAWAYLNWSARDGMIYGSAGGNGDVRVGRHQSRDCLPGARRQRSLDNPARLIGQTMVGEGLRDAALRASEVEKPRGPRITPMERCPQPASTPKAAAEPPALS